jgi:hypothetical protein
VSWSDGVTNIVNSSYVRSITNFVTNLTTNSYWITHLADGRGNEALLADLGTTNTFIFVPLPTNAPTSLGNKTNCVGVAPNPTLSVAVSAGTTANWYDSNGNPISSVSNGTTNSIVPTNTFAGTHRFFATEVNSNGCEGTNQTEVVLILDDCTNPLVHSYTHTSDGSDVVLAWYGNLYLQHATNLNPIINWLTLTQGSAGVTNYWTNSVLPPEPAEHFFRLSPTNSP